MAQDRRGKNYKRFLLFTLSYSILVLCCSCHSNQPEDNNLQPPPGNKQVNEDLIPSQKKYVRQETDEINQYVKNHNYDMQATPTGIRYMIYEHGHQPSVKAKINDYVYISYSISLLDGTLCYDSKKDGPRGFLVGKDDVESGIHQAVQLMSVGDKGLFIIPSFLAQGLVGDKDKIPPGAVVIYDITLLSIKQLG